MSLFKKGRIWHFDFTYRGTRKQGSTEQSNINLARIVEAKIRSDLVLEYRGIAPPKDAPIFKDFMETTFLEHVNRHAKAKRTAKFYREKTKSILKHSWATLRLDAIDSDAIEKYAAFRLRSLSATTVNHELATLRKAMRLAEEWKLLKKAPRVRLLPGVKGRDFVVSGELEKEYLAAATYPLREAAILILDLGLRPEEAVALRKSDILQDAIHIREGKTANARRSMPQTARTKIVCELLSALFPDSEWLFKGNKGKHYTRGALDNAHAKLRDANGWPAEFVPHSFRHTFATRLAESGADVWTIQQLMGHADIRMSSQYIHPRADHLTLALKRKEELDKILRGETPTANDTKPVPK